MRRRWLSPGLWLTGLTGMAGLWVAGAPFWLGYQVAGTAWTAATKTDVATGLALAAVCAFGGFAHVALAAGAVLAGGRGGSSAP